MTTSVPVSLERLLAYLAGCGGSDHFFFHDDHGEPDPIAARDFAERLRSQRGDHLDVIAAVGQSANRVTVTLLVEPASV